VPVLRGSRAPAGQSLRDVGIAAREAAPGPLLRRVGGAGRPLLLSLRNAFRRRGRMALTLATLATGGAVYLGASNLRAGIAGSVDLIYRSMRYDLGVRLVRAHPAAELESALAAVPGVARAEAWAVARAAVARPDGTLGNALPLTGVPAGSTLLALTPREGRWLRAGDAEALVVNRALLADEPGLVVGRETTLVVGGRARRWRVVGTVDGGPSKAAYAARDVLARDPGVGGANVAVVAATAAGVAAQRELAQRLRAALAGRGLDVGSVSLMAQQRASVEDHLLMVASFLGVMGQLMILVGGLGLASTMGLAVLERTREIGVLRAIGARRRAIFALVQAEALVVALLSWALALPLSVPMSVALGSAFGRIMFRVPLILVPEAAGVAGWLAVVVLVSVVAAAWPAWRATRVPTARALAYE
jgi:putative ABC transport system permease protein